MRSLRSREDGASLVELAFVLPILVFFAVGLWEFGRILDVQVIVNNAAREGARYAALGRTAAEVQDRVSLYLTDGLGSRLLKGGDVTFAKAQVTVTNARGTVGTAVAVSVPVTVQFLVPSVMGLGNTIKLSANETMRLECGGAAPC